MSNDHNTVFARSGPLYAAGVSLGPSESSTLTASRSLQLFLHRLLGDKPTDKPTDHATRSVTLGGAHSGEAKLCYCLQLQQVFIEAVDSTDRSDQLQQSAAIFSCKTRWVTVYVETIQYSLEKSVSFPTCNITVYLFTDAQAV